MSQWLRRSRRWTELSESRYESALEQMKELEHLQRLPNDPKGDLKARQRSYLSQRNVRIAIGRSKSLLPTAAIRST